MYGFLNKPPPAYFRAMHRGDRGLNKEPAQTTTVSLTISFWTLRHKNTLKFQSESFGL